MKRKVGGGVLVFLLTLLVLRYATTPSCRRCSVLATTLGARCWKCEIPSEPAPSRYLKQLAAAQQDFRENDRDGNRKKDYWRGDIAGLYTTKPPGSGFANKLIYLRVAAADDRPLSDIESYLQRGAYDSYWFRAIGLPGEGGTPDPDRFAACAFPDAYPALRFTYIVDDRGEVYRKDLGHARGLERFPADPEGEGWEKYVWQRPLWIRGIYR